MQRNEKISDVINSYRYYPPINDSVKDDKDNLLFYYIIRMQLPLFESVIIDSHFNFVRSADRALEGDRFRKSSMRNRNLYGRFKTEWEQLVKNEIINEKSHFAKLFRELKLRLDRGMLNEENIARMNIYLEGLPKYTKPSLGVNDLDDLKQRNFALSGSWFTEIPFAPPNYKKEITALGILDQFHNDERDTIEDISRDVVYYPTSLLDKFDVKRSELPKLILKPTKNYIHLREFFYTEFVPDIKEEVTPLLYADRSEFHIFWQLGLPYTVYRHKRIEQVSRKMNFNARRFQEEYWKPVRHVSSNIQRLKSV